MLDPLVKTLLLALDEFAGQALFLLLQVVLRDGDDERRVRIVRLAVNLLVSAYAHIPIMSVVGARG